MFPLGLENLEKRKNIFQSGKKLGNFVKTGNVMEFNFIQNTGKIKKKLNWRIEKNTGKVEKFVASNSRNPVHKVPYFKLEKKGNFRKYWKAVNNMGKVREIW